MTAQVRSIIVLGGGTAGWLTANHLGYELCKAAGSDIDVTVVDSPDIPTIGVGEGTVPAIRQSLRKFGISEVELLRHCHATFKQGIRFEDWSYNPETAGAHAYYHPFDYPDVRAINMAGQWVCHDNSLRAFAEYVSLQSRLCDKFLSPKLVTHPEYEGAANYAYHLDAGKFTELLADNAINRFGVKRQRARIVHVERDADGSIGTLQTEQGEILQADFYVDCSGFNSLLFGGALNVALRDKSKILFADRALAVQLPYSDPGCPLPCVTLARARQAGWMWDIALQNRRGTGYVYASDFCSDQQAEDDFRNLLGDTRAELSLRKIAMTVGYREQFWVGNCAAIGLSQGFVEPLEATGLLMFDASASLLAQLLPGRKAELARSSAQFNRVLTDAWERVIDFVKLHYCLSQRTDHEFWCANRSSDSIPDSLRELLTCWQWRLPEAFDFPNAYSVFGLENFLYVLYGMDFPTDLSALAHKYGDRAQAAEWLMRRDKQLTLLEEKLPEHRHAIEQIIRRKK